MKNLILQHYDKPHKMSSNEALACRTIERLAQQIGVEYKMLRGYPCGEFRGVVSQKLALLLEKYDEYDNVLMLDTDMVATKQIEDPFKHEGIGRLHLVAMNTPHKSKQGRNWPKMYYKGEQIYFGNFVKLTREQRQAMRPHMPDEDLIKETMGINGKPPNDEAQMAHCLYKAGIVGPDNFPHARFCDLPEEADPKATLLHYCGGRKRMIERDVRKIHGDIII